MSQFVQHVADRGLGVVHQRLARGVEPRADFPRRIHLRIRTLPRDGDVQLYKITRAGVCVPAVLFPVPARPFRPRTPVREPPLTRTMNRRSSKDRRMFVTDDSSDDDDDDVMIMDPPETTSSSSSALATAAGIRGVPHAPASNSATAAAASESTYKPLSIPSEELNGEEEERDEEDMSRDGPRRHSQDDDFTYADPADVRLRAMMGNRYGGQSRSAATAGAASRNDSGSVSPVTLFDEDGYAIIPDPPTSRDDSRHVVVDDDDDGDYDSHYGVMTVAPSPPKLPRKSRPSTKKSAEEKQSSTAGRSRGRSTARRTPKKAQETAPAAAAGSGARQKQRQQQQQQPPRRQSYHPPPDYPPPPPPVQATVSRPLPRTPNANDDDDDDDNDEPGPSNTRRGKTPCRRVDHTENNHLYETPISATAMVIDIEDDEDEETGGADDASIVVEDDDEEEENDCEEICDGEEEPAAAAAAAAASSSTPHRTQPLPVPPSSPRITRELGFLPGVVSGQDARFIAACLHHSHAPQVDIINTCYPMPPYTLDALSEPVLTKKALRCAGVLRPVIKLAILVNYYCVGIGRLARARALSKDLMTPPRIDTLRRRLEGLLPQQTSPSPPMCLRVLGRLNITAAQHKASCETIDQLMKPMQERERRRQKTQCAQLFRSKNLLFSPPRFTREGAKTLYMRNIKILNSDEEDTTLNLVMTLNPHPTREDVLNDAIFCLSLGNFVYNFSRALEELRGMIRCQFEDLTETLYAAYYQCPIMRDDYRVLCSEVANEITSPREDGQGLSALCRRSLAFARRCYNEGVFFSPSYVKYLIKCAAMEEAGFEGYSLESAARSLANPDIFRPLPDESSARRMLRRTIHFVRVDGTPSSSRQIPTTHIPTHANYELFLQASRMIVPQQQQSRRSSTPPPSSSSPPPPAAGGPKYSKRTFL
ncbi:M25 protein [Murine cytomegalovirus (strain K181)]|uniref:M25 protein n=2 Tax=Muromegalovirus muridbeta1 TaxID=3050323 RepID=A8E1F6_MUHVK|nr:M25 protein [Murine cytomegalovirus (strain K181)]